MKLLVTDCIEEIPISLDDVHDNSTAWCTSNWHCYWGWRRIANLLQNYQQQASESLIVNNNIHEIVHGEGLLTKKVLFNQNCGELAFPQFLRFLQKGK